MWRLIFDGGMDFHTVWESMTPKEIGMANAALDHYIELQNKKSGKK